MLALPSPSSAPPPAPTPSAPASLPTPTSPPTSSPCTPAPTATASSPTPTPTPPAGRLRPLLLEPHHRRRIRSGAAYSTARPPLPLLGPVLHTHALRSGLATHPHVSLNLLAMHSVADRNCLFAYANAAGGSGFDLFSWRLNIAEPIRSGDLDAARRLFDGMPKGNVTTSSPGPSWSVAT